ncbi:MAG: Hsp20/alpha crystallin family protein [Candidatus Omnitrophica bacterium]|nr:Hsp20/alpha crystallin family protein [Candidatus Omnitrophota bacterium]
MKLVRYNSNPFNALDDLHHELDRLFDSSFGKLIKHQDPILTPSVDVSEDEKTIYVDADLPGFEQKDIKVNAKDDILTISAERNEQKEEKKKGYLRTERFQGKFYRQIGLPIYADTGKIKATYKNGVLKLTVPKREEAQTKEIAIEVQ